MGKSKNKKKTKADVNEKGQSAADEIHHEPTVGNHAIDGHGVDGWTEPQIKAYNDLLLEREKLEKQRKELEQKSAKSHASRVLLNENENNFEHAFKQQKPGGAFTFVRSEKCCVELSDTHCHHDVCQRCKTTGISFKELDTIKWYDKRISGETGAKKDRMRNALRSQRDGELAKIVKEEEEERLTTARKLAARNRAVPGNATQEIIAKGHISSSGFDHEMLAGATKETQQLVTSILEQLDHLRIELQAGKISTADMQKQLDTIDAEMQAAQLKPPNPPPTPPSTMSHQDVMSSTQAFQNHIKDRILGTKGDNYSKAFHIMEHFLSASKPGDFQAAVAELKDVLRLSGPMGNELQKSFDALEGIFDSPDRLSFTGPDGKQECSSIIDLMAKMKDTLQRTGKLPEGANSELVSVFDECIKLEADGKNEMLQECHKRLGDGKMDTDPRIALVKIKTDIVARSPIPPLTEQKLVSEMLSMLYYYDAKRLMTHAKEGKRGSDIEALMTGMVMTRAQKDPEKFVETFSTIVRYYDRLRGENSFEAVDNALPEVQKRIRLFAEARAKQKAAVSLSDQNSDLLPERNQSNHMDAFVPQMDSAASDDLPADLRNVVTAAVEKWKTIDMTSDAHIKLKTYILEHGQLGLWPLWLVWTENEKLDEDFQLQDKALAFEDASREVFMHEQDGSLVHTVVELFRIGACPAIVAGVITQFVTDVADTNPEKARIHLRELAKLIEGVPEPVTMVWSQIFQRLAFAIIQLYAALHVNCQILFPSISPLQFATASVSMVVSYICLTRSAEGAAHNFNMMWAFISTCMSPDGVARIPEFHSVAEHFMAFSQKDEFRCLSLNETCVAHMNTMAEPDVWPRTPLMHRKDDLEYETIRTQAKSIQSDATVQNPPLKAPTVSQNLGSRLLDSTGGRGSSKSTLKTTIHYRKRLSNNSSDSRLARGLKHADELKRAIQIYKSTARRALKLMQGSIDDWNANVTEAPHQLLKIMDEMLVLAGVNYYKPTNNVNMQTAEKIAKSKFSEQLDERLTRSLQNSRNTQHIHDIFKAIEDGRIPSSFVTEYVDHIKTDALSGRWTSPSRAFRRSTDRIQKFAKLPDILKTAIETAQIDIDVLMQMVETNHEFATKRLQCLLWFVKAKYPGQQALYDLAIQNHAYFEEYCALVARAKLANGEPVDEMREHCSDALERVGTHRLHHNSRCLTELAQVTMSDWITRDIDFVPKNEVYQEGSEDSDAEFGPISTLHSNINQSTSPAHSTMKFSDNEKASKIVGADFSTTFLSMSDLSSQSTMNLKTTVGQTSTISKAAITLRPEQSAQVETADYSDMVSQADGVQNGSLPTGKTTGSTVDLDQNGYTSDKIQGEQGDMEHEYYNVDSNALNRYEFAEVELVMRLQSLDSSFKSMQETRRNIHALSSQNQHKLSPNQLKAFDIVDQKMEERVDLFRNTASMIVEDRDYRMVRGYFREDKKT